MRPRMVVLIAALSLAAGWSLNGRFGAQPGGTTGAASRGPRPLGVESMPPAAPLTEQLRRRLDRQTPVRQPSRNPFVFGPPGPARAPARVDTADATPEPAPPAAAAAESPAAPAYTLSGIAASKVAEGVAFEYTAILSGSSGLVFARIGDALEGGFEVVDVRETAVTLRDGAGGERTLRLR